MSNVLRGAWACTVPCSPCGGTCSHSQPSTDSFTGSGISLGVMTSTPFSPPLGVPTGCNPVIYLVTPGDFSASGAPYIGPVYEGVLSLSTAFSWTYSITYDGTSIFTDSGTATTPASRGSPTYISFSNTSPFTYNPSGLTGYSTLSLQWVLKYGGTASMSTNPPIVQEFTATGVGIDVASFDFGNMFLIPVFIERI